MKMSLGKGEKNWLTLSKFASGVVIWYKRFPKVHFVAIWAEDKRWVKSKGVAESATPVVESMTTTNTTVTTGEIVSLTTTNTILKNTTNFFYLHIILDYKWDMCLQS